MTSEFHRRKHLEDSCRRAGLYVRTYSPGDGVTRYRFFRGTSGNDYFGPENGIYTALGLAEAFTFVNGALAAIDISRTRY